MSLPTSIPWLLYRTPLLVSYRKTVPNIDTNWVFKRDQEKQVPRSQSWRGKKSVFHGHTVGPWSRSHRWEVLLFEKASTEHVDSEVLRNWNLRIRFESYSESDTQGFSLGCLPGVIPKKEAGNPQRRYGYRNLWLSVLLVQMRMSATETL